MKKNSLMNRTKKMTIIAITIVLSLIIILLIGGYVTQRWVNTPVFKNAEGKVISGSIAEYKRIKLNGNSQAVLIRGENIDNPVILFLHAGPGVSETGMFRNHHSVLEKHYTMVYLDQRGAAKSYSIFNNPKDFNKNQLVLDIHELTQYLKEKFDKNKIIIMGHSFGASFGLLTAYTYPEDYLMYIGIAPGICMVDCDRRSYPVIVDMAKKENNKKAIEQLEKIEGYWETDDKDVYMKGMMVLKKWVGYYGGQLYGEKSFMPFLKKNVMCDEYTFFDWLPYFAGMMYGTSEIGDIMLTTDFRKQASEFKMPFIIVDGCYDYNAHPPLIEEYFDLVKAPMKKIFWFDNSAHFPHFEEKELFQKIMIEEILPIAKSDSVNKGFIELESNKN